jgi:hypothetical protein
VTPLRGTLGAAPSGYEHGHLPARRLKPGLEVLSAPRRTTELPTTVERYRETHPHAPMRTWYSLEFAVFATSTSPVLPDQDG